MKLFGKTRAGEDVHAITLSNGPLSVSILTYGAILQDVRLDGVPYSLTLGSDNFTDYLDKIPFHGSVAGPVVNRISTAQAEIDGNTHHFDKNLNGRHTLHGGSASVHNKVWQIDKYSQIDATLSQKLPDGAGGFPGNRTASAHFEITEAGLLSLTLTTQTDASSIANLTNHSYWNLDGSDRFDGHQLKIPADFYLPTTDEAIPTGEVATLASTPFDFREPRALMRDAPPLDNTFCIANARGALRRALSLSGQSGLTLDVHTTEPGIHLFDARSAARPGRPNYEGIAIEAQSWPDAPNQPHFPSIAITPESPSIQTTTWQFSRSNPTG